LDSAGGAESKRWGHNWTPVCNRCVMFDHRSSSIALMGGTRVRGEAHQWDVSVQWRSDHDRRSRRDRAEGRGGRGGLQHDQSIPHGQWRSAWAITNCNCMRAIPLQRVPAGSSCATDFLKSFSRRGILGQRRVQYTVVVGKNSSRLCEIAHLQNSGLKLAPRHCRSQVVRRWQKPWALKLGKTRDYSHIHLGIRASRLPPVGTTLL